MAALRFTVTAFSSQSEGFDAKSIDAAVDGKWQSQAPGSHEFVIIQLVEPSVIGKLVVQNNNAAIFSVEASEQRDAQEKSKWQVLLGTSSLMKPSEARDGTHGTNSFTFTKFKDETKNGLWHCLKFNVYQPFDKNLPCGLSSVQVYSSGDNKANQARPSPSLTANTHDVDDIDDDDHFSTQSRLLHARGNIRSLISSGKPTHAPSITVSAVGDDADDDIKLESDDAKSSARGRPPAKASLISKTNISRSTADDSKNTIDNKRDAGKKSSQTSVRAKRGGSRDAGSEDDEVRSQSSRGSRGRSSRIGASAANGSTTTRRQTRASSRQSNASSAHSMDDDKPSTSRRASPRGSRRKATTDVEEAEEMGANGNDFDAASSSPSNAKKRRATSPNRGGSRSRQNSKSPEPDDSKPATISSKDLLIKGYNQPKSSRDAGSSSSTTTATRTRGAPRVLPLADDEVEDSSRHGLRSDKPFHKIMDDVVFSLSGFVNPERGQLRSDAIQMGARYKPDWTDDCNYLICAFPDTPKFDEANACNARIVKKDWINECCRQRKLLPWRQYRLFGYENAVDDDNVDDVVIRDSAAEVAEDKENANQTRGRNRRGAASSSSSRRGRGRDATSSTRDDGVIDNDDDDDDEGNDRDAALAVLLGDDEDEDQDYVPDESEAEAAEEEEEEDAADAPDPAEVAKEEAEADAEVEPEDEDDDDIVDFDAEEEDEAETRRKGHHSRRKLL